jgi:hypothetical protein
VNAFRGESRDADGDVVGPLASRRAVADPFPPVSDDPLSGPHVENAPLELDAQRAAKDDRVLVELGTLSRLLPSGRGGHLRDAHP